MIVRVIRFSDYEEYCDNNNIDQPITAITDEQFMEIWNNSDNRDWEFSNPQDFADEFNTDGAYAPMPSEHIIHFFNE